MLYNCSTSVPFTLKNTFQLCRKKFLHNIYCVIKEAELKIERKWLNSSLDDSFFLFQKCGQIWPVFCLYLKMSLDKRTKIESRKRFSHTYTSWFKVEPQLWKLRLFCKSTTECNTLIRKELQVKIYRIYIKQIKDWMIH